MKQDRIYETWNNKLFRHETWSKTEYMRHETRQNIWDVKQDRIYETWNVSIILESLSCCDALDWDVNQNSENNKGIQIYLIISLFHFDCFNAGHMKKYIRIFLLQMLMNYSAQQIIFIVRINPWIIEVYFVFTQSVLNCKPGKLVYNFLNIILILMQRGGAELNLTSI